MDKHTITTATLAPIVVGSLVDTLVAVTRGSVVLCYGDATGVAVADCIPASTGYQIIVPAGVDVSVAAGPLMDAIVITAPFGA